MGATIRVANVLAACAVVAGALPALAADKAGEVAAIHAVDQAWLKAYTAADADAVSKLYDENAVLLPPGAGPLQGRAAIKAYFAKDATETAKAGMTLVMGDNPAGGANGDMGWASGTFVVKDKSGKTVDSGKYLSVSKKVNGKWLYLRDTWNSDTPPPPAKK